MQTILTTCFAISGIALLALGMLIPGPAQQSDTQTREQYQKQSWVEHHCDWDPTGQALHCR